MSLYNMAKPALAVGQFWVDLNGLSLFRVDKHESWCAWTQWLPDKVDTLHGDMRTNALIYLFHEVVHLRSTFIGSLATASEGDVWIQDGTDRLVFVLPSDNPDHVTFGSNVWTVLMQGETVAAALEDEFHLVQKGPRQMDARPKSAIERLIDGAL